MLKSCIDRNSICFEKSSGVLIPDQGPSESVSWKSLLMFLSALTGLLAKMSLELCKVRREKAENWSEWELSLLCGCLTSTEQLEFVAVVVVKVLQCKLRTVTLPEHSPSGKGGVFPDTQENIYLSKVCQKASSESERNDTSHCWDLNPVSTISCPIMYIWV